MGRRGLIDAAAAARIRDYETEHAGSGKLRWPAMAAIAFGALMLGGGVLLFVAAHWDALSPGARFAIVLTMVGGFHVLGALVGDSVPGLSAALHGVGTVALGAGISLAGQIFNLDEHWPSGISPGRPVQQRRGRCCGRLLRSSSWRYSFLPGCSASGA